jgi:hypothetical protein
MAKNGNLENSPYPHTPFSERSLKRPYIADTGYRSIVTDKRCGSSDDFVGGLSPRACRKFQNLETSNLNQKMEREHFDMIYVRTIR